MRHLKASRAGETLPSLLCASAAGNLQVHRHQQHQNPEPHFLRRAGAYAPGRGSYMKLQASQAACKLLPARARSRSAVHKRLADRIATQLLRLSRDSLPQPQHVRCQIDFGGRHSDHSPASTALLAAFCLPVLELVWGSGNTPARTSGERVHLPAKYANVGTRTSACCFQNLAGPVLLVLGGHEGSCMAPASEQK